MPTARFTTALFYPDKRSPIANKNTSYCYLIEYRVLGSREYQKNISGMESLSIGLSVLGSIAATVTQQIAYIATPLTLSLSLSLINRHKELVKANQRLANLERQLIALPEAPTTIDFHRLTASVRADGQELKRLGTLLMEIENRDNDLSPFLTEIDLTKDSLNQLSLSFSNFEQKFNNRQDDTSLIRQDREFHEIRTSTQIESGNIDSKAIFVERRLKPSEFNLDTDFTDHSIKQIKSKIQFLEESSKVSEDAIKQIEWQFLELKQEFAQRQKLVDISNLNRSLAAIDSNIQTIGSEFSRMKTDQIFKLTGLEADLANIYSSIEAANLKIQSLENRAIGSELVERFNDLDSSLSDLHDYSLKLNNRIEHYYQDEIAEIIDAAVVELNISNLIQQEVGYAITAQFKTISQLLPNKYSYDLVCGREASRQIFLDALQQSQERLILVCPWLTDYAINPNVKDLIRDALSRGVSIDIGWGHLKDVNNDQSRLSKEELLKSKHWSYNVIPWLYELQIKFKDNLNLSVLGTHEKFLVCDRKFAMLGSHNYMTSDTKSSEREVGIKTDSPELIDKLIESFDRGNRS